MTWELLWKIVFIGVVSLFALLSVLVTILGARDVKRMLKELKSEESEEE